MEWTITHSGANLEQHAERLIALGSAAPRVLSRALNHEGNVGRTEIRRATASQMGLPYGLMVRAIKSTPSTASTLTYTLRSVGGRISLKYFGAREGGGGVKTKLGFEDQAFITSGRIGARRASPALGGHVYRRINLDDRRWGGKIEKLTGPSIPEEMMKGEPLAKFRIIPIRLEARVGHEITRALQ